MDTKDLFTKKGKPFGKKPCSSDQVSENAFATLNPAGFRTWDEIEKCVYCNRKLLGPCLQCRADLETKPCLLVEGKCKHVFHKHCIERWTKTTPFCPMDNELWVVQQYGK